MKKLLLITLTLTMPQAYGAFRTTGKTTQQLEQQRENEERELRLQELKQIVLKLSGPFLSLKKPVLRAIESINKEVTIPTGEEPLIKQTNTVTIADIHGLINALTAAATSGERKMGLPKLHAGLLEIYNNRTIQDLYKTLIEADEESVRYVSPSKGNVHTNVLMKIHDRKFVDTFARNLFTVLFEGKTINDLIDLTSDNLASKIDVLKELPKLEMLPVSGH